LTLLPHNLPTYCRRSVQHITFALYRRLTCPITTASPQPVSEQELTSAHFFQCETCSEVFVAAETIKGGRIACPQCGAHHSPQSAQEKAGGELVDLLLRRVTPHGVVAIPGMARYEVRRRQDGRWEAIPSGVLTPLFVFDTEFDLAEFMRSVPARGEDASQ
jgi:hypothetical protein